VKYPTNKLWLINTSVTSFGVLVVTRAVLMLLTEPSTHLIQLLEIAILFAAMVPWSVKLPSGASWRPAMPLVMISIFILPPELTTIVAIPGLVFITARVRAAWWKYPQTIAHVGLGLYCAALTFQGLTSILTGPPIVTLFIMAVSLLIHLAVNRAISALIVAERTDRTLSVQMRLSLRELHLGYVNSYLIVMMAASLYSFYGAVTFVLAAVAQVALMRAVSYYSSARQLQQAAWLDGLTGVENRASWEKLAEQSQAQTVTGEVVVLDLDSFKSINDQFGHAVGDSVIRDLAQSVHQELPKRARIFRYGGDEFVVYDALQSRSDELLKSIRTAVRTCSEGWSGKGIRLGVSMGHAIAIEDGTNLSELFSVADARMYEDKHRHRLSVDGLEIGLSDTVIGLIAATETRDRYTAGHNLRVAFYALELAKFFRLESQKLKSIFRGSIVHDIGKIGIPDALLSKPAALTPEERMIVETHPQIGYDMCVQLGFSADELAVILYHHEKWDGSGYPRGLKEEDIPQIARIVALADIYDALTSERAYRSGWRHEDAMNYILKNSGTLFEPACVEAWRISNQEVPLITRQPNWIHEGGLAKAMARMT
jgi:diguanylate cyclase (GGDEF)-like protein